MRVATGVGVFLLVVIMLMVSAAAVVAQVSNSPNSTQSNKPNSTFVVKQNQNSPARVSCLARCDEARKKYRADCNKSRDPVEVAYCIKRGDSTYNFCAGKCPAK